MSDWGIVLEELPNGAVRRIDRCPVDGLDLGVRFCVIGDSRGVSRWFYVEDDPQALQFTTELEAIDRAYHLSML